MKSALVIVLLVGVIHSTPAQVTPGRRPVSQGYSSNTNTSQFQRPNLANTGTNLVPGAHFATNRFLATNYPARRFLPNNPGSLTNQPRGFVSTNPIPSLPFRTNLVLTNMTSTNLVRNLTNAPASTRALITPAQRQTINRISIDLGSIRPGSPVAAAQQQGLLNTLQLSALGPVRPSPGSVTKLANDLISSWPPRGFTPQQRTQLAVDLSRVLNSGNLSPSEAQLVLADARRVLQTSGVAPEMVEALANDLVAIVNEVQQAQPNPPAAANVPQ